MSFAPVMFQDIKQYSFSPMHMTMRYSQKNLFFNHFENALFSEYLRPYGKLLLTSKFQAQSVQGLGGRVLSTLTKLLLRQRVSEQLPVMQERLSQGSSKKSSNPSLASELSFPSRRREATQTRGMWQEGFSRLRQLVQIFLEFQRSWSLLSGTS